MDVLEAAERVVDAVFRFAVAIDPAGDRDLVVIDLQRLFAIGHRERDFGHAERLAFLGAVEDDIGHFATAQSFGGGFAEHPADRIDHIGFAAAVGADDASDALGEFEYGLIGEGLEALDFESFEVHGTGGWEMNPEGFGIPQATGPRCRSQSNRAK